MKLDSLTKLLVGTALLLGVTAAIGKPAAAEGNTSIVCIDRTPEGRTECERSLETVPERVESCNPHPKSYCEDEALQQEHPTSRRQVERRVEQRREHPRQVEHPGSVRPNHPRPVERRVRPRSQRRTHPRQLENRNRTTIDHRFYCESGENGVPTTFVETAQGTYPVVRWVSDYFTPHGYDPMTRCRQVSDKFEVYFNKGNLNYITTGIVNHQPVICVSDAKGGSCQGVLFTLKPEENASNIIQRLFDLRSGAASGPLLESGSRLYLDLNQHIEEIIFNSETDDRSFNSGDRW